MVNRIRILRPSPDTTGRRPAPGSQPSGVPYVSFSDNQFGVVDSGQNPRDLIGVPFFSTTTNYNVGQPVNYLGKLYTALVNITAGAWNALQWQQVGGIVIPPGSIAYRNLFRNSAFDVWQRGTGAIAVPVGSWSFGPDGWQSQASGAAVTVQRYPLNNVGLHGPTSFIPLWLGAAGNTGIAVMQRIESIFASRMVGQVVTAQFRIYNNTGASITPVLNIWYANTADNFANLTPIVTSQNLQTIASGSWGTCAYSFTMPTSGPDNGIQVQLGFPGVTSNYFGIQWADIRVTVGVANGLNNSPPDPELRTFDQEIDLCSRYYQVGWFNIAGYCPVAGVGNAQSQSLTTQMRATPTIGYSGVSGVNYWNQVVAGQTPSAVNISTEVNPSSPGAYVFLGNYLASAEL